VQERKKDTVLDELYAELEEANICTLLALMQAVHGLITYGWEREPVRHDGTQASIIALATEGRKFTCGTFQRLFSLLATETGFQTREVALIRRNTEQADQGDPWLQYARHQVVSVDIHSRLPKLLLDSGTVDPEWTLFDPTTNAIYRHSSDGPLLTVEEVLARVHLKTEVVADFGSTQVTPSGPAYRADGDSYREVLTQEEINKIFDTLHETEFLAYYDGYAVWKEDGRVVAYCPDPTYRPTTHLGIPLNEMFGGDVHWEG